MRDLTAEEIRAVLTGESPVLGSIRRTLRRIPSSPRCKLCAAPFSGIGGAVLQRAGFARYPGNPRMCSQCIVQMRKRGMRGVEIPVSLVFSDVRGSTSLGEQMRPEQFHAFLAHFYELASEAILRHDGIVDKIVGDEVIGLFFGAVSGREHARAAVAAALDLADRAARPSVTPRGSIPVGTAVHTGNAFVGATGPEGAVDDFTALGDPVNTTARLASSASAGEVLASTAVAAAAGALSDAGERRLLPVRGRTEPVEVVVLRATGSDLLG